MMLALDADVVMRVRFGSGCNRPVFQQKERVLPDEYVEALKPSMTKNHIETSHHRSSHRGSRYLAQVLHECSCNQVA